MGAFLDLTGLTFGRLTVKFKATKSDGGVSWNCKCLCGKTKLVSSSHLNSGHTKSCGCYRSDKAKETRTTHGMTIGSENRKVYTVWRNMIARCTNLNNPRYVDYGARGIGVCEHWLKFENFFADMGRPENGRTLERKNNDKGYSQENCVWASPIAQNRNRRSSINITYQGVTRTLVEWQEVLQLNYPKTYNRIMKLGWAAKRAFTTP